MSTRTVWLGKGVGQESLFLMVRAGRNSLMRMYGWMGTLSAGFVAMLTPDTQKVPIGGIAYVYFAQRWSRWYVCECTLQTRPPPGLGPRPKKKGGNGVEASGSCSVSYDAFRLKTRMHMLKEISPGLEGSG